MGRVTTAIIVFFEVAKGRVNHKLSEIIMADAITLIFVVLKLTKNIDWAWYWVISPTIIWELLGMIVYLLRETIKY
jgi:hypothetical protein